MFIYKNMRSNNFLCALKITFFEVNKCTLFSKLAIEVRCINSRRFYSDFVDYNEVCRRNVGYR